MIRVDVTERDGRIAVFEMSGHAEFDVRGKDLVCAGASAVSFGAVNAIEALTGVEPEIEQADAGYLKVAFPEGLERDTDDRVQLIVRSMIVSLQTIEESYGDFIQVTFRK
ncbi:ribosomal-processing cysteine protease Prp [Indiicoccus explosivorum]|uniref:ribosomal-processing cysteine protease Prp n=1 Tax=Indiicoccus explosivorum TaxID=1917864 RepID=UPI000B438AF2|nr:ribosomal-processing cysteine protease Prp [Indiicoccus explosivorum]